MINSNEYIFFEADQVLTNDHLNESFNYLDHQARWTRNKLIGIGIACGLEVVINSGIEITKGCGVTSQGYLIVQHKEEYHYYIKYSPIAIPTDLPFKHNTDLPFYEGYDTGKQIFLLLTDAQYNALEKAKQKTAVAIDTKSDFLEDYAVALFLEMKETDLKNCDMQDCNNEGEKIVFTVRPLLVPIAGLLSVKDGGAPNKIKVAYEPHQIHLKRYNVPYKLINNSEEVLKAFYEIVDNTLLSEVSAALNYCYDEFGYLLKISTNPFTHLLAELKALRDHVFKVRPIFIEYFYDFIDDLIKAYYELSKKVIGLSTCCPDVHLFPLHLILGAASQSTDAFVKDAYRDYFMYSGLFSKMEGDSAEAILYFQRIVVMIEEFAIQTQTAIKITPSQYELPPLSARAIPYYYYKESVEVLRNIEINKGKKGTKLYKYWNYNKTIKKEETFNLSYNADTYTSNAAVVHPLLYDIEHYNFFRIEGHIGENHLTVLEDILAARLEYNLPFDVVAVSADQLHLNAPLPACNMQDLETAYHLILSEAACKIHTIFCYITHMRFRTDYDTVLVGHDETKLNTDGGIYTTAPSNFSAYKIIGAVDFETPIAVSASYKRGDFLRKNCNPKEGTLGFAYLRALSSKGVFTNPLQSSLIHASKNDLLVAEYHFFQYIEAVEELMLVLYTHTLAEINIEQLVKEYRRYLEIITLVIRLLMAAVESSADGGTAGTEPAGDTNNYLTLDEERELSALTDELGLLLSMCIDERIDVLKREYVSRLSNYQQQLAFFNYYKKHPGLEHKAGVPKGGTFVLVYYSNVRDLYEPVNAVGGTEWGKSTAVDIKEPVAAQPSPYGDELTKMIRKFVDECKDASPTSKKTIITALNPPASVGIGRVRIPDGAVIADFYIPYMCCSDCPPVAYIMPEPKHVKPKPVEVKPTINPAGPFCSNDTDTVQLTGSPAGGTFGDSTGAAIAGINTDGSFTPNSLTAGSVDVYYEVKNVLSDKTTIVITDADSDYTFPAEIVGLAPTQITFTANNAAAGIIYNWQITPDNKLLQPVPGTSTLQNFVARFTLDALSENKDGIAVSLTISNGACKSSTTKTFIFAINESQGGITVTQLGS